MIILCPDNKIRHNMVFHIRLILLDKSASTKISAGKKASNSREDSEVDPELWTGVLSGLLVTVLLLAFLIGFLVRLQANRARLQRYTQETSLATLTGETTIGTNNLSSKEKDNQDNNLNKLSSKRIDYPTSERSDRQKTNLASSSILPQVPFTSASPTDPDVVQLQMPSTRATGK